MILVSPHQRLNPETCPKLIANVRGEWEANPRETTIYKGFAYHVDVDGNIWTCYQGAARSEDFYPYSDRQPEAAQVIAEGMATADRVQKLLQANADEQDERARQFDRAQARIKPRQHEHGKWSEAPLWVTQPLD